MREPLDLEPIKARAEAAFAGPWLIEWREQDYGFEIVTPRDTDHFIARADSGGIPRLENATFIAYACIDIPALIAEVERLRQVEQLLADDLALLNTHMHEDEAENRRLRELLKESADVTT